MIAARIFVLLICLCSVVSAQEMFGSLEGRVVDANGEAIVGASVSVTSASLQGTRGTSSDERGIFRILFLSPGTYAVRVSHIGFGNEVMEGVRIRLGQTTGLGQILLQSRDVQMSEVVISGARPLLDPSSTVTGSNLMREDFELLPIERNYRGVAAILPHANASYLGDETNFAGSTGAENRYFVNGADVTDEFRGLAGTNLPYNFIKEVEVRIGGYEPEYRSALGGIINVITQSGGNEFSGQVFGFYTSKNLASEQRVAGTEPPKGSFAQYDFGFGLGGPIVRDRLWFYAAYSPSYRDEDVKLPGLGYYPDETRSQIFAGKLTWKASESFDVTATILGDPTKRKSVGTTFSGQLNPVSRMTNPDALLSDITTGGYTVTTEARLIASNSTILQGVLSLSTRKNRAVPSTQRGESELNYYDAETATLSGGYPEHVNITNTSLAGQISGTFLLGDHLLKAGLSYKELTLDCDINEISLTRYSDTLFATLGWSAIGTVHYRAPSVFVQDSWSVTDHLRLTGGIRWDGLFIIGSDGSLMESDVGQYQPRLGVTFLIGNDGSQKIFASLGRYAEDLLTYGSTWHHISNVHNPLIYFDHDPRKNPSGGTLVFDMTPPIASLGLRGQYYDEVTAGYERLLTQELKMTARGIYRTLREVIEDGEDPPGSFQFYYGNPGHAPLSSFPPPRREYLALELSLEKSWGRDVNIMASYVLSRTYGNYAGMYDQDSDLPAQPSASPQYDFVSQLLDATGLLPNDRTHSFKLVGSYRTPFGLTCGASFWWTSGTPLNIWGASVFPAHPIFLVPRGTAGRLPSIWDLSVRLSYDVPSQAPFGPRPRLILDVYHIGSPSTVVQRDQTKYLGLDANGNQSYPNPVYGSPMRFQPPMSMRLGLEVGF